MVIRQKIRIIKKYIFFINYHLNNHITIKECPA